MSAAAEMLSARLFTCQLLQKYYRLGCLHVSCCRNVIGSAVFMSAAAEMLQAPAVYMSAAAEMLSAQPFPIQL
jgi:hypothetical protein